MKIHIINEHLIYKCIWSGCLTACLLMNVLLGMLLTEKRNEFETYINNIGNFFIFQQYLWEIWSKIACRPVGICHKHFENGRTNFSVRLYCNVSSACIYGVLWYLSSIAILITTRDPTCPRNIAVLHSRQLTLWLHDPCLRVLTVHGTELSLFRAKAFPLLILLMSRIYIPDSMTPVNRPG